MCRSLAINKSPSKVRFVMISSGCSPTWTRNWKTSSSFSTSTKSIDGTIDASPATEYAYFRAAGCFIDSHAPPSLLDVTHCWMKYIPSTPSYTFG